MSKKIMSNELKNTNNQAEILVEESSGNIFADLDMPNPTLALAKAQQIARIRILIDQKQLIPSEVADILKVTEAEVLELMEGGLDCFADEQLSRFLETLTDVSNFSSETIAKANQLLPDLDWQNLLDRFKQIYKTVPNTYECFNQARQVLCQLRGLPQTYMRLPVAEVSAASEKNQNLEADEPQNIKGELYELADELMEQLTDFWESHP
jgi:predicted XRE-type DNA-binding protein